MSDKTTAAIAAEQQAEAPEAPAEALPAVTLDELEQVDLGTVERGERAPLPHHRRPLRRLGHP